MGVDSMRLRTKSVSVAELIGRLLANKRGSKPA